MSIFNTYNTQQNKNAAVDEADLLFSALCLNNQTTNDSVQEQKSLKEMLLNPSEQDKMYLKDLLSTKLTQGSGETIFELGIEEDGTSMQLATNDIKKCIQTLTDIAQELDADIATMNELNGLLDPNAKQKEGHDVHLMIRKRALSVQDAIEVRVAVLGNVDAGKSTMLGVLTKGALDDGRGKARAHLFRFKHEIESGRTSSVGSEILGFTSTSRPITQSKNNNSGEVMKKAAKVISFIDLAGHEKYLKTTVFGMTGSAPEFVMLMVGANAGMVGMSKEHLGLAISLGIPVFVVITKIDQCPAHVLEKTKKDLATLLKSKSCRKIPLFIKNNHDVVTTAMNFVGEKLCPIFQVSNVTGQGLDFIRNFLNILPCITKYDLNESFRCVINETYSVPFVGTVVCGVVNSGTVKVGDKVLLGPDYSGEYISTKIKGIHRHRVSVSTAKAGQAITFALKNVKRNQIRKGQVLLFNDKKLATSTKRYEAEIMVLYHSTQIKSKYQAMVHCGAVQQTAKILSTEKTVLRTGDRAKIVFEFIKKPEYLVLGSRLIFREGRTTGVGKITRIL